MKKIILMLPLLLVIGGCSATTNGEETSESTESFIVEDNRNQDVTIYTDPETKVQYFLFRTYKGGGITPRLNPDGTPHKELN